jgi:hypothetical protein
MRLVALSLWPEAPLLPSFVSLLKARREFLTPCTPEGKLSSKNRYIIL